MVTQAEGVTCGPRAIETKDPSVIEDRWPGHTYTRVLFSVWNGKTGTKRRKRGRDKRKENATCGGSMQWIDELFVGASFARA